MSSIVVDSFNRLVSTVDTNYTGNIYGMYGHKKEINRRLLEKDKDKVFKYQKYPLIALNMPFSESIQQDASIDVSLNIAIMNYTEETYISEERYDQVFKPVLEPIYELFLQAIEDSPDLLVLDTPIHTRIDRLFWGNDQQDNYQFSDPLDAIELVNLQLKIINTKC